ncbi:Importin-beta N-terminal domain [Phytophthora infestans]|uniref:Importin-beta N-terminal domain n=1 Tax=Phytophthora infestans TaxID=4787 RepID=A0A833SZT3_PHYIN|nr:Importin-beta N-terminal domain [Phytophthora infestans]KAF4138209.1 Importin-beta N-terminal domain [Phytophthora infestans]
MDANQLRELETLCRVLYESGNEVERAHAQQAVLILQSSAEYIPQCQYVLDNSSSPYALLVASTSLTKLITSHWNNFTTPQRVDIRNYVLGYLAQKGPTLEKFVTTSLIQMVCRLTKYGWFDDEQHREIVAEVTKFLQATVDHCVIGLQILSELVTEMDLPVAGRNITFHRKIAVSFREDSLFRIFQVALTSIKQLQMHNIRGATPQQEARMGDQALSLLIKCLSFDFIGTNPDESSEETGSLQVPTSWRSVIQDPDTLQLLFDFYKTTSPPNTSKCLEALMLFASVRRNLFSPDKERSVYLAHLLKGICAVLRAQEGLSDQQNYHEFCRLIGRLKSNYQLSELMTTESFQEWMDLTPDFTIKSFRQWQWSANSTHYLLALWARLVAALPYVRADAVPGSPNSGAINFLDTRVPQVIQAYLQSRLDSAEQCALDDTLDNPLDDEGGLYEQLEKLPTLCHFNYRQTGEYIVSVLDPILNQYTEACSILDQSGGAAIPPQQQQQLQSMENQAAWLVYAIGAIIGGQTYSSTSTEGDELVDADLSQRVFRAMQLTEHRIIASGGQTKPSVHFELSLLYYFSSFRKSYIGEQHGMPSAPTPSSSMQPASAGSASSPIMAPSESAMSSKHKAYLRMFERLGLGDHTVVVNMMVTKVGNNLKFWGGTEVIISKTLVLFFEVASGYSSGKLLLGLETVQYLIGNHTAEEFPFLAVPANTRHRTTFHSTIARLIFTTAFDESSERFERFMEPIENVLNQLLQTPNYRVPEVREAVIGVCRDLRGIIQQTHNRRTYSCIFDLLYPAYFPVFARAADELYDHPAVTTALLKFLQELAYNKAQRVTFDQSSASGILLFRELSSVVVAYGRRIQPVPAGKNPYGDKYKGVALCLGILYRALGGSYVNFGVFQLYNDKSLENALEIALQLVLSIPHEDLMHYPKVKNAYFFFLEILFRNQLASVVALEDGIFRQLVQSLHEGMNSYDLAIAAQCATAVDHVASLYFHEMKKKRDTPVKHALRAHVQASPNMWSTLLAALLDILVYGEANSQWALSRPILSLTLCSEEALTNYQQQLSSSQPPENRAQIEEAFAALFADVRPNLEAANRDKFTQRLGQFRNTLRGFLTIQ